MGAKDSDTAEPGKHSASSLDRDTQNNNTFKATRRYCPGFNFISVLSNSHTD